MRRKTIPIVMMTAMACSTAWGQTPVVGDLAPVISVPTWENLPKGMETVAHKDLGDRILLIEFWATW